MNLSERTFSEVGLFMRIFIGFVDRCLRMEWRAVRFGPEIGQNFAKKAKKKRKKLKKREKCGKVVFVLQLMTPPTEFQSI